MSDIGIRLGTDKLVLTRGRDFKWTFDNLDDAKHPQPINYPPGALYFEPWRRLNAITNKRPRASHAMPAGCTPVTSA